MYSLLAGIGLLVRRVSYCLSHCAQRPALAQYDPNMIRRDEGRKKSPDEISLGLKLGPGNLSSAIWVLGVTKGSLGPSRGSVVIAQ